MCRTARAGALSRAAGFARKRRRLTDLERAARFLYLQKTAFGGKVTGQSFGVTKDGGARFNLTRLAPLLEEVHERMAGVVIECLGWAEFLDRWDRKGMLFYLDPPYWNGETDYGKGVFSRADFAALAKRLRRLKGRFILSINDLPEVREGFSGLQAGAGLAHLHGHQRQGHAGQGADYHGLEEPVSGPQQLLEGLSRPLFDSRHERREVVFRWFHSKIRHPNAIRILKDIDFAMRALDRSKWVDDLDFRITAQPYLATLNRLLGTPE